MSVDTEEVPRNPANAPKKSHRRGITEWLIVLVVAIVASFLVRTFVFQTFYIPSSSMKPTLWKGNRIMVDKLSVDFGTINIGDIVVFKAPPAVKSDCQDDVADLVKRVIGVPGDHLTSKGNTIYVNGKPLDQKWSHYTPIGDTPIGSVTVPKGQYYMMGDNHANSCDSRYWGTVPRSDIIGKVFLKFWPLSQLDWY
jgi:signal peptidase I